MATIGLVQPLSYADYRDLYARVFLANTTEYRRSDGSEGPMLSFPKLFLQELRPRVMLSIGAGSAAYDAELLTCANLRPDKYLVIEPNPHQWASISENLGEERTGALTIIKEPFGPSFDLSLLGGDQADFIMFAHTLYFIPQPALAIEHALRVLRPGGKLLVQQQAHLSKVREFYVAFTSKFGLRFPAEVRNQDHRMTSRSIAEDLDDLGIRSVAHEEPAAIITDSFFNTQGDTALDLLNFILNTDVRNFPLPAQEELKEWIRSHSERNPVNGHWELSHPQGFVIVEKSAA